MYMIFRIFILIVCLFVNHTLKDIRINLVIYLLYFVFLILNYNKIRVQSTKKAIIFVVFACIFYMISDLSNIVSYTTAIGIPGLIFVFAKGLLFTIYPFNIYMGDKYQKESLKNGSGKATLKRIGFSNKMIYLVLLIMLIILFLVSYLK